MENYVSCRKNMIDGQLRTSGITDLKILDVFERVPREKFLSETHRSMAYIDEDILIDNGCFLMEPVIFARLLQVAQPKADDVVLNMGDDTGYAAAILSYLSSTVVTLESKVGVLDRARKVWAEMDICNIAVIKGRGQEGCPEHGPYSLIVINGSIPALPDSLPKQLSKNGRIVTIIKEPHSRCGKITIFKRDNNNVLSSAVSYDAATPFLQDFEPVDEFVF